MMMKKSLIFIGLVTVGLGAKVGFAAETSVDTSGTVNFKAGDGDGTIIKPEVPSEEIEVEGGGSTKGSLRIQHVPDFNFGTHKIQVGKQIFNPTLEKYTLLNQTEAKYIPHFIQVTDERGTNEGWHLTVKGTSFKTVDGDELPYASITLKQAKLSNDVYDNEALISSKVKTFNGNTGERLIISNDGVAAQLVMGTRDNTSATTTNGSRTSIVLNNSYDKDKTDYLATDLNDQVDFIKTNKDIPVISNDGQLNKLYTSTITWTLTDGI